MARIPYAADSEHSADLNLFRMLAHSPPLLEAFKHLGGVLLSELSLSPRLREAAILRTGLLARATYEVTKHEEIGRWVGLTKDEIAALDPDGRTASLEPALLSIVKLADELHAGTRGSDATLGELRLHLTDREVVEAVVTTGFYGMVCRVLQTLGIELETASDA